MREAQSPSPNPSRRFCAAPWLESVLYNDGSFRICSRNSRKFGDWRRLPLAEAWKGEELQQFRRDVAEGRYPDNDCAACHQAGTSQTLGRILSTPLVNSLRFLVLSYLITYEEYLYLQKIAELFDFDAPDADARVAEYEERLKGLIFRFRLEEHGEHLAKLKKIQNIVWIIKAWRAGDPVPPVVGPFRQVQLIAKCNARCVMCPGKFSGEIVTGDAIDPAELEQAMNTPSDIVDFFCNGSEFLLFKGWREVARTLRAGGVASLRLSTNGMLLTKENAEFLVDERVIGHLNVSFNAGSKETLERVQKNVRWDRLLANVDYILEYAEKKKVYFPLSFSFIVMRSNFHELPLFLERVAEWKRRCTLLVPHVMVMSLENAGHKAYRYFLYEEHPALAERAAMISAFRESAVIAERESLDVELYNFGGIKNLQNLAAADFPFPEFFHHPKADQENIEDRVRELFSPECAAQEKLAQERIQSIYRAVSARQWPYPSAEDVAAVQAEIAQGVERLQAAGANLAGAEGFSTFGLLFARFPEFARFKDEFVQEWVSKVSLRLRQNLNVFADKIFREIFGFGREDLPDHRGEKYVLLDGPEKLSVLAPGALVLGANHKAWRFFSEEDGLALLEDENGRWVSVTSSFVIGAFLFKPEPKQIRESDNSSSHSLSLSLDSIVFDREDLPDHLGEKYLRLEDPEKLALVGSGTRVLGADHRIWRFLSFQDGRVLLEDQSGGRVSEAGSFVIGLFLFEPIVAGEKADTSPLIRLDSLVPGDLVVGADTGEWVFLRARSQVVYLQNVNGRGMRVMPSSFLIGSCLGCRRSAEEIRRLLLRADLHWWIHSMCAAKKKLVQEKILSIYRAARARRWPYPSAEDLAAVQAEINQEVDRLKAMGDMLAKGEGFSEFGSLAKRFPEFALFKKGIIQDWVGRISSRLGKDLGAFADKVFRELFGFGREDLPDHLGEKYLHVKDPEKLAMLESGTRVLGANYKVLRFLSLEDGMVLLEDEGGRRVCTSSSFVIGVFLFESEPEQTAENAAELFRLESLVAGDLAFGADFRDWVFLRLRNQIVYLQSTAGRGMRVMPASFLIGSYLECRRSAAEIRRVLLRADLHWWLYSIKNRVLGRRKSRVLWHLAKAYRFCLKGLGMEMPSDLVIESAKPASIRSLE